MGTTGDNPKVSVIIPAYNVEKYIDECLKSVVSQTFTDLEIVFVDNCSTDSTLEIAGKYANMDSRIRIYSQSVHGISETRNVGIDNARGEWILFVDADDYIAEDSVEVLLKKASEDNVSVVLGMYRPLIERSGRIKRVEAEEKILRTKEEIAEYFFTEGRNFCHLWQKLCRRELFPESPFVPGKKYEDIFFMPTLIEKAKGVSVVNLPFYTYRVRPGSTVFDSNIETHMNGLEARMACLDYIRGVFPGLAGAAGETVIEYCCYLFGKIIREGRKENLNSWEKTVDIFTETMNSLDLKGFRIKAATWVFSVSPVLLGRLCRLYSYLKNRC